MVRPDIKIIISEGDNLSFSGNHSLVWSDMEKYNKEIIETSEFKDKESFEQQIRERVVFHYMGDVFPDVKSDMILSVAPYAELGGYLDEHMKPEGVAWIVAYEPLLYNFLSRKGTENLSIITEYPRLMQTNNYTDFSVREKTIDSRYNIIMINGPVGSFMPKSSEQFMPEKGKLLNVNPTFTDVGYLIWNKNADEIIERNRSNMVDLNDPEKMINKIKQSDKPVDQTVSEEPALFADEKIESLIDLAIKTPEKDKETVYVSMVESIIQARDEIGKPIDSKLNSYYLKAKMNDLGRAKDHKLYKQRAMEAFNSIDPDVILGKLIEQRGKLISQEQFDFFTGSQERIYEDSYFNQGKDRPSTNSMVLSILLVLSVNESARIEGGLEPLLNHVVKYGKPVLIDRLMSYSDNSQKYSKERQNLFFKIEDKVRLGIEKAEREIKGFK